MMHGVDMILSASILIGLVDIAASCVSCVEDPCVRTSANKYLFFYDLESLISINFAIA